MGRPRKNGKTLEEQARDMINEELNQKKVKTIARILQQVDECETRILKLQSQKIEYKELIRKIESGDQSVMDDISRNF